MSAPLELLVRKLRTRTHIAEDAAAAIMALKATERTYRSHSCLIREGQSGLDFCAFIISGYALRQKAGAEVGRQIVSVQVPGDFIDLQQLFLRHSDHGVKALSELQVIIFERSALRDLAFSRPEIGIAMWSDALVEAAIYREWIASRGRDAKVRIAHLLCELATREKAVGLSDYGSFSLPMTQEQLGDCVGITNVHVSRTLKALCDDGVIQRTRRSISIADWPSLQNAGDFTDTYLHLDLKE